MPASWYALYTKPRCERTVSERLRSRGFETYLPALTVEGVRGRRYERPFFPRYLFVRLDPSTDALSSVRWTPGLKHVVRFEERPAIVPDEVVVLIQERLATLGQGDKVRGRQGAGESFSLSPGLQVSLSQLEAVFERSLKPADRALMLISFLGRLSVEDGRGKMERGKGRRE